MTSEDIKHQLIIFTDSPIILKATPLQYFPIKAAFLSFTDSPIILKATAQETQSLASGRQVAMGQDRFILKWDTSLWFVKDWD